MVATWRTGGLILAGGVAGLGYTLLAVGAAGAESRLWLWLAHGLGWAAVGVGWWLLRRETSAMWPVVLWAVAFRLMGIGVEPSWEDDYHRYLWDGYQTMVTGTPYAMLPMDAFGHEGAVPESVLDALDLVNHPELPTVYGPVPQFAFLAAAWMSAGELWALKLVWLLLEVMAWVIAWPVLGRTGRLLLLWCPLVVIEVGFAAHLDAVVLMALAMFFRAWQEECRGMMVLAAALAVATKVFGLVLLPFMVVRWGWRPVAATLLAVAGLYLPFGFQGVATAITSLSAMGTAFEYNSLGYAMVGWWGEGTAQRIIAAGLALLSAGWVWWRWRRAAAADLPPCNAVWALVFWWSPVINPWYALWLVPLWAMRPQAWTLGMLIALPIAYTHGWGQGFGAPTDYTHPSWSRPLEMTVFLAVLVAGHRWSRSATPPLRGRPTDS